MSEANKLQECLNKQHGIDQEFITDLMAEERVLYGNLDYISEAYARISNLAEKNWEETPRAFYSVTNHPPTERGEMYDEAISDLVEMFGQILALANLLYVDADELCELYLEDE